MPRKLEDDYASKKEFKSLHDLMVLVVIVLFIGFAAAFIAVGAMVTSFLASRQEISQNTRDQIKQSNDKVDLLSQQITALSKTIQDSKVQSSIAQ